MTDRDHTDWDDATLIRLLDGELSDEAAARIREAQEADPALRARLNELRSAGRRFSALAIDVPVPETPKPRLAPGDRAASGRAWILRLAAGMVLLAALGLASPQVRAWVVQGAERVAALLGAAGPPAPEAGPEGRSTIILSPTPRFLVEVASGVGGALVIRAVEGDEIRVTPPPGSRPALTVVPGGLRIADPGIRESEFLLELPGSVEAVEVRRGSGEVAIYHPGSVEPGTEWRLELDPGEGAP